MRPLLLDRPRRAAAPLRPSRVERHPHHAALQRRALARRPGRDPDAARLELRAAAWGFRPVWMRQDPRKPAPINARAETAATSGLFRDALERRRCLVPADGFYEWRALPGHKKRLPVRFTLKDGGLFAFAGLFTGPRSFQVEDASCAILTTRPNALVAPVHDRMPVILRREDEALWLDPTVRDPVAALVCCQPFPAELMACYDVDPRVGSPLNDEPALVAPWPPAPR